MTSEPIFKSTFKHCNSKLFNCVGPKLGFSFLSGVHPVSDIIKFPAILFFAFFSFFFLAFDFQLLKLRNHFFTFRSLKDALAG